MNGVVFNSKRGNAYLYDNNSGHILYVSDNNAKAVADEYIEKLGKYQVMKIQKVNKMDVKDYLISKGNGCKQLILEVTSQCNFRCKYCCYSDCYELTHGYNDEYMDFITAKKAVDYYIRNFEKIAQINPLSELFISFYGGEPLLNFDIVQQIVSYIKDEYRKYNVSYNITTNGYLLNDKVSSFLVKNDFAILVSLDGSKKDHDRNRKTVGGKGTFDVVMKNVRKFKKMYPDYLKFSFSSCYDFKTDLIETKNFFENENLNVTKFSPIDRRNTNYYDQFTQDDIDYYNQNIINLKDEMYDLAGRNELKEDKFVFQALGVGYLEFAYHTMIGDSRNQLIPYSGTCIPGEKIYISSNGKMHICEKINPNFQIGDVEIGLDFERIANMINTYNEKISRKCINCEVNKLCSNCFVKFATKDNFIYDMQFCEQYKEIVKNNLIDVVNLLEENPAVTEKLTVEYYDHLMKFTGGC